MENDVQIIIASTKSIENCLEQILPLIAPCYRNKSQKMKHLLGQCQEALTGLLLKVYLGINNDEDLTISSHGKPELTNHNKHFSVSHSGECVVLAISDSPIGVDIEKPRKYNSKVANRIFTKAQLDTLNNPSISVEEQEYLFCKYWTRYEAIVKKLGGGIQENLSQDEYKIYESKVLSYDFDQYIISYFR